MPILAGTTASPLCHRLVSGGAANPMVCGSSPICASKTYQQAKVGDVPGGESDVQQPARVGKVGFTGQAGRQGRHPVRLSRGLVTG